MLETSFSGIPKDLMLRVLQKDKNAGSRCPYSEELKASDMSLQFYSSKAYGYVRKTFDLALPFTRQIDHGTPKLMVILGSRKRHLKRCRKE